MSSRIEKKRMKGENLNLKEWEERAIKVLLQQMMQLGIIACLITLIFEFFYPHGLDYAVTICFLVINTLGLGLILVGYERIAFHAYILAVLSLFVVMDWGYDHRYYSAFKIFALGVVFLFVVVKQNRVILTYVGLITLLECLSVYSFIKQDADGDILLLIYEWIHVVAYNFALAFMCYFFVNQIIAHRRNIRQKDFDNQQLSIKLAEEQNQAYQNLLIGQEKERARLSQDIHDGLSIRLAQLKSKLQQEFANSKQSVLTEVLSDFEQVQDDLRNISHALSPTLLKDFGLEKAINDLLFQIELNDPDIDLNLNFSDSIVLNPEEEKHLYYIIQELLANAIKHGDAKIITIELEHKGNQNCLIFKDSGKGYEVEGRKETGIGLSNIKSRVAVLNGKFLARRSKEGMEHIISFVQ